MYAALWRVLPGALWVKIGILTAGAAVIIALLMIFVFPAVDTFISSNQVTVNS